MHPIDAARNELAAWYAQAERFLDAQLRAASRDGRITVGSRPRPCPPLDRCLRPPMNPVPVCDRWLASMTDEDRGDRPAVSVAYRALHCHRTGTRPDAVDGQARRELRPSGMPGEPHWGRPEWRRHAAILLSLAADTLDPVSRQWLIERASAALDCADRAPVPDTLRGAE